LFVYSTLEMVGLNVNELSFCQFLDKRLLSKLAKRCNTLKEDSHERFT